MKARHSVITMALASIPLALAGTALADDAKKSDAGTSPLSAEFISPANFIPGPATVFLNDSTHIQLGVTPLSLLSNLFDNPGHSFMLDGCHIELDDIQFTIFGPAVPAIDDSAGSSQAIWPNQTGVNVGTQLNNISFHRSHASNGVGPGPLGLGGPHGGNENPSLALGSTGGVASDGGGGGGGNSASTGGAATMPISAGDNSGNGNGAGSTGSQAPPPQREMTDPVPLGHWLPPSEGAGIDQGSSDSGVGPTPLPLPAPVWMALGGLVLVIVFRKRLMP